MDRLTFKAITDVGLVRTNNEDSFIADFIWDDQHVLCAAIDGVGGYEGGEVAAEIARSTIIEFLNQYPDDNLKDVITQAVLQANNNIYEQRKKGGRFPNMSCVVSAAIVDIRDNKIYIAHVGDSRIYLYDKGRLTKLTHDHSLVGYREEIGELTEEEAMNHPQRNIIERCLGDKQRVFGESNFIESSVFDIPANGKFVFCSDGLTDMVTSQEIIQILAEDSSTTEKCSALIECAKSHGGKDNVTVVLVETEQKRVSSEEMVATLKEPVSSPQDGEPEETVETPSPAPASPERSATSRLLFVAIPVIALAVGLLAGLLWGKRHQPEPVSAPLSWKSILEWCVKQSPVDTAAVRLRGDGDSVTIPIDAYNQFRFYQDHVTTIISLKDEAAHENDSLYTLLSVKDSLLDEALERLKAIGDSIAPAPHNPDLTQ